MGRRGLTLTLLKRRALKWKRVPQHVNRFARSASAEKRAAGVLPTMRDEIVLAFSKPEETVGPARLNVMADAPKMAATASIHRPKMPI
jgi:hypothetical protein